jgi:integrase
MNRATCPSELDEAKVLASLDRHPLRSQTMWVLGAETGLRVSELCSLLIGDVWREGVCRSTLRLGRSRLKGGRKIGTARARRTSSREIPLNEHAQVYVARYLQEREQSGPLNPQAPLFPSRQSRRGLTRWQAWRDIRKIFLDAGLDPSLTWSPGGLRRRFVRRVWAVSDLETAKTAVGHRSATTTAIYLFLGQESAVRSVLAIGRIGGGLAAASSTSPAPTMPSVGGSGPVAMSPPDNFTPARCA